MNLDLYETLITVPDEVVWICGTTANLCPGDVLSINDLLYGLMLPSGNDAAFTLAKYLGEQVVKWNLMKENSNRYLHPYSEFLTVRGVKNFIKYMNYFAWELNMLSTFYDSPHGLQNNHNYSTALD